jgi:orotidine-5'-phosphate decarboxylase
VVLGVTSNEGELDFQFLPVNGGQQRLFEKVMARVAEWGTPNDTMFVVGATRPDVLAQARAIAPRHFFLVPGVGAQGGDLEQVLELGLNEDGGLLINSSRSILYASKGNDAIAAARNEAERLRGPMERALRVRGLI